MIEKAELGAITVSIGLAEFRSPMDSETFVKAADDALYLIARSYQDEAIAKRTNTREKSLKRAKEIAQFKAYRAM